MESRFSTPQQMRESVFIDGADANARLSRFWLLLVLSSIIAAAQAEGLHASVVGRAKGRDFASGGSDGDLFRLPLDHLREMHEGWMPGWIEAVA